MNRLRFYKYHGAGNDFIMIDDRESVLPDESVELYLRMCDRHFGIGADGVILIREAEQADFEMRYYNADGKLGSMCGNGGRCAVKFARSLGIIDSKCVFLAYDGIHHGEIGEMISISMSDVITIKKHGEAWQMDTGSPHLVLFKKDLEGLDVFSQGKAIRYSEAFRKEGINVNFAALREDGSILMRTYERGVENETLACGTGTVAVAIAAHEFASGDSGFYTKYIDALGGSMAVSFRKGIGGFTDVMLSGPAQFVYEGIYDFHS